MTTIPLDQTISPPNQTVVIAACASPGIGTPNLPRVPTAPLGPLAALLGALLGTAPAVAPPGHLDALPAPAGLLG